METRYSLVSLIGSLQVFSLFAVSGISEGGKPMSASAAGKSLPKTLLMANIVDATDLTKKQVVAVFAALAGEINANLGAGGPGRFTISGL